MNTHGGFALSYGDKRSSALRGLTLAALAALALAGLMALGLALRAAPATAAFPGENGSIVFTSTRDGNAEVYVMDADGQNQTRLTNNTAPGLTPAFSPDGTQIAFSSSGQELVREQIYVMDADGQNQINLTNNSAYNFDPAFSPDGTKIAFTNSEQELGPEEVYVMDADGQNQTNLTNNAADDYGPAFSPDGTKIAFISRRDGNYEIYVMDADGQNQTNLTNNAALDLDPAFSPDGTKIAFTSSRDGNSDIYVMDADGQNQTRLTNNAAVDGNPDWGPATEVPPTTADLIDSVEALGLPSKIESRLLAKLDGAEKNIASGDTAGACGKLTSFIKQVKAQSGKKIPAAAAADLIADAEAVRESLGCG